MSNTSTISKAAEVFNHGGILVYPTEAVFGLGCDPDNHLAIKKLLAIKERSINKGLILLASNYSQLLPYINDSAINQDNLNSILSRWPGPITQILPAAEHISSLLSGCFDSIAVRITDHPDIVALCNQVNKPIISTSANLSGELPALTWQQADEVFKDKVDFIIKSKTSGLLKPSTIINAITGEVVRS